MKGHGPIGKAMHDEQKIKGAESKQVFLISVTQFDYLTLQ
jgi:hypothetical protein